MRMPKFSYTIRTARFEELTLLPQIEQAAASLFRNTPYAFLADGDPLPLDFIQQQFQSGQVWVAVDRHETIVGYAIVREVDNTVYLQEIDVLPEHGRRGIGAALVNTVCDWARQRGDRIVSLSTFRDIPWNAPFYAKLGFCILKESELTTGFQQIRQQEMIAGLPIAERVIMQYEIQPS
jgi:GNAT superfamily N-acetyltransferase